MIRHHSIRKAARFNGASAVAMALSLSTAAAMPAQAQSLQGTPTVQSGGVTFSNGSGQTIVTVSTPNAVVDWAPFDTTGAGNVDFQPFGTTATFMNDPTTFGGAQFAILNRIIPTNPARAIELNGAIRGEVHDMLSGFLNIGQNVWFYSPGGIVVGGNATIDVGRLALTTSDPVVDGNGSFTAGGTSIFQASNPASYVRVLGGAQFNLPRENSYIAVVAPSIVMTGDVNVNGSAALVAAEAATLTVNQGLFDIQVTQGTDGDVGQAITVSGNMTGPASTGPTDGHRIYMVAVPKNDAISVLIQGAGQIGFDVAGAADFDGNAVVLSGGYDISDRLIAPSSGAGTGVTTININDRGSSSALYANANGEINIRSTAGGTQRFSGIANVFATNDIFALAGNTGSATFFERDASFSASFGAIDPGTNATAGEIRIRAFNNGNISFLTNLSADSSAGTSFFTGSAGSAGTATAGLVALTADTGGTVTVQGNTSLTASAAAGPGGGGVNGGNAVGGTVLVTLADGGTAQFNGALSTSVAANAGNADANGGNAAAGAIRVTTVNAGNTLTITGDSTFNAPAVGGATVTGTAGNATGGILALQASNASTMSLGNLSMNGGAFGGDYVGTGAGAAGSGQGGDAFVGTILTGGSLTINGTLNTVTSGSGGNGFSSATGGNGTGGVSQIQSDIGNLTVVGQTSLFANGNGGLGAVAGTGTGGMARAEARFGGVTDLDQITLTAVGTGGDNSSGSGRTGNGQGGSTVFSSTDGGQIAATGIDLDSSGLGGIANTTGVAGGNGTGGLAIVQTTGSNARVTVTGSSNIVANGVGADGNNCLSCLVDGGNGTGGTVAIVSLNDGGTNRLIDLQDDVVLSAQGTGGRGQNASGGDGIGGTATVQARGGQTITLGNLFDANASGTGGDSGAGITFNGGLGRGGIVSLETVAPLTGTAPNVITAAASTLLNANGTGGNGTSTGPAATGGNAQGGTAFLGGTGAGSVTVAGASLISASSQGGSGGGGGDASLGNALVRSDGAGHSVSLQAVGIAAIAAGGTGRRGGDSSGNGTAGNAQIIALNSGAITTNGLTQVYANGESNNAINLAVGGIGTGGTASISQGSGGTINITGNAEIFANGTGANALGNSQGGAGNGGDARFVNNDNQLYATGNVTVRADGTGGDGGSTPLGVAGAGGTGTGGLANIGAAVALNRIDGNAVASAVGQGGNGSIAGAGGSATGGQALIGVVSGAAGEIRVGGTTSALANGRGGLGFGSGFGGGNGSGGTAQIFASAGQVNVNGTLADVDASGTGGNGSNDANGGSGTAGNTASISGFGGDIAIVGDALVRSIGVAGTALGLGNTGTSNGRNASIDTQNVASSISIGGAATVSAQAFGQIVQNGTGGAAQGGSATINARLGPISITGNATANAGANGTVSTGGAGGDAIGGVSLIGASDLVGPAGVLTVGDTARALGSAIGGNGATGGGNATGGIARLHAFNGDTTIGTGAFVTAAATGGNATVAGAGGAGLAGPASALAQNGDLIINGTFTSPIDSTIKSLVVQAAGIGGNGAAGGAGGAGTGSNQAVPNTEGGAQAVALSSLAGPSLLRAGVTDVFANGRGGTGGTLFVTGQTAGAGGTGTGGVAIVQGSSGNGSIQLGNLIASSSAFGGTGGAGLTAGAGGIGTGGATQVGLFSQIATPTTAGTASFGNVTTLAEGIGGNGGGGGAGAIGGAGTGGFVFFGVRGGPVNAGDITLSAAGRGGNGGVGSPLIPGATTGAGGIGTSGQAGLAVTERFAFPATIGNLTAGVISIPNNAQGGTGSTAGAASQGAPVFVELRNGNLTATSVNALNIPGVALAGPASRLSVINGAMNLTGGLTLATSGNLFATVENGSVTAGAPVTLSATNFITDPVTTAPVAPGNLTAPTVTLTSGLDVIASANLVSTNPLTLAAPGLIRIGALSGASNVTVNAAQAITAGNITSGANLLVESALSSIAVGTVSAVGDADIYANGGATTFTSVTADAIDIDGLGNVTGGVLDARDGISVLSGGTITIGNLAAGITAPSTTPGADYSIGVGAIGNVATGNVAARGGIALGSDTGALTAGTVTAGTSILALADGPMTFAGLSGGTTANDFVYLADNSMAALGGPLGIFNPAPIFAAAPVATSSSITVNGPISAGRLVASSGTSFTAAGAVTASTSALINAAGLASFGGLVRAPTIAVSSGNLALGTTGALGDAATQTLTLTNTSAQAMILGGALSPTGTQYQIDSAEFARVTGQNIVLLGSAANARAFELRDFTLNGAGGPGAANLVGTNGSLTIGSTAQRGVVNVTGDALLNVMTPTNRVTINAGLFTINTDTGSLILEGASPGGTLVLFADAVHIGSASLLSQLAVDPLFTGRDAALGTATGIGTPTLQARTLNITARDRILIQNNGAAGSFAGFNAYVGAVSFTNFAAFGIPGPVTGLDLVAYGSLFDPVTGLTISNTDVRDLIFPTAPAAGLYSATSAINGCLLSAPSCFSFSEVVADIINDLEDGDDLRDEDEREEDEEVVNAKEATESPITPPVTIVDQRPLLEDPPIDEPVTGAGNPALIDGGRP